MTAEKSNSGARYVKSVVCTSLPVHFILFGSRLPVSVCVCFFMWIHLTVGNTDACSDGAHVLCGVDVL